MPSARVHLVSLGCAKNLVDSERLLGRLAAAGAVAGAPAEEADILLVNTCGFIQPAKEESIDAILALAEHKRADPRRKLIVVGCLAQRHAEELRAAIPEADGIFGLGEEAAVVAACGLRESEAPAGRLVLTPRHTAYVRLADGCDNRCAYCAIPLIRGPFRSRPYEAVLAETEQLVAAGAREINLIGQDTTRFGVDLYGRARIHELLRDLARIRGLRWLRLLYTHPAHFTDELVEAYATVRKLCPYIDLPLQHLNDRVLKRMGRKTTQAGAIGLIRRLRAAVPAAAIRTTFIVGFPGETRAEFNEMRDLVRALRFDHLGVFTFSREQGTRAARMGPRISERAAARRRADLMRTQQAIAFEKNAAMVGREIEVVIDRPAPEGDGLWIARSRRQAPDVDGVTIVHSRTARPGRFLQVRVTDSQGYDLTARAV
jgi:ribosomal protein S12 methylthiotransferase